MSSNSPKQQKVSFTATETVSLPSDDPLVMGIRSRDWKRLRQTVEDLSADADPWELVFTISTTIFFSFLVPALTTSGDLSGWRLAFASISLLSFGISLTSLTAMISAKARRKTERSDVIALMNDIQSLYGTDPLTSSLTDSGADIQSQSAQIQNFSDDELYLDAKRLAYQSGKISTSLLQRRLRIGYGRASRIIDRMETEGIVGEPDGSRPREVYPSTKLVSHKAKSILNDD